MQRKILASRCKDSKVKKIQHRLFSLQSSPGSYCSESFRQVGKLSVASTCVLPLNTNLLGVIQPVPGVLLGKLSEIGNGRIFRSDRAKTKEVWFRRITRPDPNLLTLRFAN